MKRVFQPEMPAGPVLHAFPGIMPYIVYETILFFAHFLKFSLDKHTGPYYSIYKRRPCAAEMKRYVIMISYFHNTGTEKGFVSALSEQENS